MKDISRKTALQIIFLVAAPAWLFVAFVVIWGFLELCGVVKPGLLWGQ